MEVLSEDERRCILEISKDSGFRGDIRIEANPFTKTGDHYLGVLSALEVTGKDDVGNPKTLSLVLKKMYGDKKVNESLNSASTFGREVDFYSQVAPAFRDFQKKYSQEREDLLSFIPKCYKAKSDGVYDFLILEDLRKSGFTMRDRKIGLSYEECNLVMQSLGTFHAFSYAMKQKEPDTFNKISGRVMKHPFFMPELRDKYDEQFQLFAISAEYGARQLSTNAAKRLEPFLSNGFNRMMTEFSLVKDDFSVIVHGDPWTNNVLFRGNPPSDIRFLDYQIMSYTSPIMDVMYNLNTSVSKTLRDAHFDDFLQAYHSSLTNTLRKLGANPKALPMHDFKDQFRKYAMNSLGSTILAAPVIRGGEYEEEKHFTEEDAMAKITFRHSCCMKDSAIQRIIVDVINEYIDRGFID